MAHAQKQDFVFRRIGPVHLNRRGVGWSVQLISGSRGLRISGGNSGYNIFRGSVKGTGSPLHWPVPLHFPSHASPCAITFQLESTLITVYSRVLKVAAKFWTLNFGAPVGKRPLGRPRLRLDDNIKMDLQEVGWVHKLCWSGLGYGEVMALVIAVMNFRVP